VILIQHPDNQAIADTAAAVFRALAHNPPSLSAWDRFVQWLMLQLFRILQMLQGNTAIGTAVRVALWTVVVLGAVWIIVMIVIRSQESSSTARFRRQRAQDYWHLAQQFAAKEQYTEAAHALYAGLLHTLAQQRYVVVHDSKTIGEYVRETRKRAPTHIISRFTEFTRSYETVVYRLGVCDAARYAQLLDLATHISRDSIDRTNTKSAA